MSVVYVIDENGEEQERWEGHDYDLWETAQAYEDLALEGGEEAVGEPPEDDTSVFDE